MHNAERSKRSLNGKCELNKYKRPRSPNAQHARCDCECVSYEICVCILQRLGSSVSVDLVYHSVSFDRKFNFSNVKYVLAIYSTISNVDGRVLHVNLWCTRRHAGKWKQVERKRMNVCVAWHSA